MKNSINIAQYWHQIAQMTAFSQLLPNSQDYIFLTIIVPQVTNRTRQLFFRVLILQRRFHENHPMSNDFIKRAKIR